MIKTIAVVRESVNDRFWRRCGLWRTKVEYSYRSYGPAYDFGYSGRSIMAVVHVKEREKIPIQETCRGNEWGSDDVVDDRCRRGS